MRLGRGRVWLGLTGGRRREISPKPIVLIPVSERFSPEAASGLPDPERRRRAAHWAASQALPSTDAEEWRYSPIEDFDLEQFSPQRTQPVGVAPSVDGPAAATITLINGYVTEVSVDPGWAAKGLEIGAGALDRGEPSEPDTKFDGLHAAFSPTALIVTVPDGLQVTEPIVVLEHHTGDSVAAFPHVRISVGEGAEAAAVVYQTSTDTPALIVGLTDLVVAEHGTLRYEVVQNLGAETWLIGQLNAEADSRATVAAAIAAFGGRYSRVRCDTDLIGRSAHGDLAAAYYADGSQTLDFRTFQRHRAPNTTSDLLFKGASDDQASSIYTGLIHIHPQGAGSNAYQTNRNIKLSEDAWAWSVPNLEIENNDVRCSHASTVSPIDEDQQFYLQSRGVPPVAADELIVAGFFDETLRRFSSAVAAQVRTLIAAKLRSRVERVA